MGALDELERGGGPAGVTSLARREGVWRTYLDEPAQHDLLERLARIRSRSPRPSGPLIPDEQRMSPTSHEHVVRALRKRNQRLTEENATGGTSRGGGGRECQDFRGRSGDRFD